MEIVLSLLLTGTVAGLLLFTIRRGFKHQEIEAHSEASLTLVRDSSPPVIEGSKAPRERRQDEIKFRRDTKMCLYCDKPADHVVPQLKQLQPLLDPLYRYLNVVPVNRWKIELEPGIEVPQDVCRVHHAIARSHLERKIAENQVDYASFVERQRHEMYEFVEYSLDERMLDDANTIKRGKKPKKLAEVAQIPQRANLKAVNGGGG